jgi:hypothetical protein
MAWQVDPIPGSLGGQTSLGMAVSAPRYYQVRVSVRCAVCETKMLFDSLAPYVPNSGQAVGATEGGTLVVFRTMMPPQLVMDAPQWQRMQAPASPAAAEAPPAPADPAPDASASGE